MQVTSGCTIYRLFVWILLEAGLETDDCDTALKLTPDRERTTVLRFQRIEDEPPAEAEVTLKPESEAWRVTVMVRTNARWLAERFEALLTSYAATPGGGYRDQSIIEERRRQDAAAPASALTLRGLPPITADGRARGLDEATARVLIEVYETNPSVDARREVLFALQAPKTARPLKRMLAAWLMEQFARFDGRRHRSEIGCALMDLAGPQDADRLVALVEDPRLGQSRDVLLLVLAVLKAPRAASVLGRQLEGPLRLAALQGLKKLGKAACDQACAVEPLLADKDPEVRRAARSTLKRISPEVGVGGRPKTSHVVSATMAAPNGFADWSTNLDLDDLADAIVVLGSPLDAGLGPVEASEVIAVVDGMKIDQTRLFRFPVTAGDTHAEVFLKVYLDDEESPDLYVFAAPNVLNRMLTAWQTSRFHEPVA